MIELGLPILHSLAAGGGHGDKAKPPLPAMGVNALWLAIILAIAIVVFLIIAKKGYHIRGPKTGPAKLAEHVFLFLDKIAISTIGSHGKKYVPFLASLWTIIFAANILGLVSHVSPTANMSFNLGMSILTILVVQWEGIKQNGPIGHLKHFAGPKLPSNLIMISGLIFVVEMLSESAKVISLALRLYGNIAGGKLVVGELDMLVERIVPSFHAEVPIGSLLVPIKLLTCIIQPFVWVVLTCVYLGMVTHEPHDDHHHDEDHPRNSHPVAPEAA